MKNSKRLLFISMAFIIILGLTFASCSGGGNTQGGGGGNTQGGGDSVQSESSGGDSGGSDTVTNWSFYCAYGPEDGACTFIWPELFEQVKEQTGGRLVINTYWAGQHPYAEDDLLKALEDGSAQLAHFYGGYLSSVETIFAADSLPLMFPVDSMEAWKVISGIWGNFSQDKSGVLEKVLQERWNASMVHMVPASPQRFFTVGFEVDNVDSLKGHKIRTYSPEFAKVIQIMGGTPVSLSFSEVYTSLSTNLIDGLITSTAFAESGGFFDHVNTIGKWELTQSTDGLMVSLDALNALPNDVRETFLSIMHASATKPEMLEVDDNNAIVERLLSEGVIMTVPSDEVRETVKASAKDEIWDPWLATVGAEGQELLDQINSLMN